MSRTCYDAVNPWAIPANAEVVAGYIDGLYAWDAAAWARFPNAIKVTIAVWPSDNADVLDVEQGDAAPSQAPGWIRRQQARGLAVPTIYCSTSVVPEVQAACAGLTYDIWSAHYTGVPHIEPGSVATQYADPAAGSGGDYDVSLCEDFWPRIDDVSTQDVLDALNQGTAPGQPDWASTNKAILQTVQQVYNLVGGMASETQGKLDAIKTELDHLGTSGVDLSQVYARLDALSKHLGLGMP